jgi:hypothetical protein
MRASSRRSADGVDAGSVVQSGSSLRMDAMVSPIVSPANGRRTGRF